MDIYNITGYFGAMLYLVSYALLNLNKVTGNSYQYIGMNTLAAIFVVFSCIGHWNGPSFMIQAFWIIFSVIGLAGIYKKSRTESAKK